MMEKRSTLTNFALFHKPTHFIFAITLFSTLLTGCRMNDPMIQEMEAAYAAVEKRSGDTHEERDEAVTRVVQKYFPPGMKKEDAFKLLRQLKEKGFDIGEYRHEGARNWPDGELKPYMDEATRRNLQRRYPMGMSHFSAQKKYGTQILVITKHVAISFNVADDSAIISEPKGTVWASGI